MKCSLSPPGVLLSAIVLLALAACGATSNTAEVDLRQFPEVELEVPPPAPSATEVGQPTPGNVAEQGPCTAPDDPSVIELLPRNWSVGEGRELEITKRSRNGTESSTPATVSIVAANDDGSFVFRWDTGQTTAPNAAPEEQLALELLGGLTNGLTIDYLVAADGSFDTLLDADELLESIRAANALIFELNSPNATAEVRAQYDAVTEAMLSDDEFVDSLAEDPQLFHSMYGFSLNEGERRDSEAVAPNPFGDNPVPAALTLSDFGRDAQRCANVSVKITPDVDALTDELDASLSQLGTSLSDLGSQEQTTESDDEPLTVSLRDETRMRFDEGTGWPRQVSGRTELTIASDTRKESTVITILGPIEN